MSHRLKGQCDTANSSTEMHSSSLCQVDNKTETQAITQNLYFLGEQKNKVYTCVNGKYVEQLVLIGCIAFVGGVTKYLVEGHKKQGLFQLTVWREL